MRRLLARLFLALALASAGPAAYAHWISHLAEHPGALHHADDAAEHQNSHACELCAAFSGAGALGTAPAPQSIAFTSADGLSAEPHNRLIPCEALERFASRAPPLPA